MTNFLSEPFENATVSPVEIVNSEDGTYRFGNENLSSFNFDGIVPTIIDESYVAQLIEPGMYFVIPGSDGTLRSVIEISLDEDDPDLEMQIVYVGENNLLSTYTCNGSDLLTVQYESWSERVLGTQGWTITSGGNAIFSNVAVRGDIEAQTLNVGGSNGITYDGTDVIIGASVTILGGLTIGEVQTYLNDNDYTTQNDLDGYIPDGQAAADIITNATTITGGNISTGRINSSGYNGPATGGGSFSTVGSQFNLDDGTIVAPNFRIDNLGNAFFQGDVTGSRFSTSSTVEGDDFGTGRIAIRSGSVYGFDGPMIEIRNFSTLGPNSNAVRFGLEAGVPSQSSDLVFKTQGVGEIRFIDPVVATRFEGSGVTLTNLNPANISAGTAGISITGNAATATTATTATSAGGLFGSPGISVNSVTINNNGIINNSGQIISPPTYNNANSSLVANQHVTPAGVFRRAASTQRIKTKITPLNKNNLSNSVQSKKIFNGEPEFDYNLILSITPVEYTPIEEGEEQEDIRSIGFIAEDIADKTPSIATYDLEGMPEYYNINSIVASMLAVVQDQQKIIEDLQNRVLQLESQLGG